jgi:16S rRNA (cytosine1407-C5)-methyltransferase
MIPWSQNPELAQYLTNLLDNEYSAFVGAISPLTAIRLNELKTDQVLFEQCLDRLKQKYQRIPFNRNGYTLQDDHLPLSHTLYFFLGHFQYQNASSQLPVILLDVQPGQRVLDMAAAPGSKSTQLAAVMQNQGELVLNDAMRSRHQPLNVNMQRSGAINYYVINAWGERMGSIFPEYFDKILLDAPCSALGTIHSSPAVWDWWSLDKMQKLSRVQYQLLVSAIKALKAGGELVYSTCSITPEENEMLLNRLIAEYPLQIVAPPQNLSRLFSPGWLKYAGHEFDPSLARAIRVWPQHQGMEGFFAVKLRKLAPLIKSKEVLAANFIPTLPSTAPAVAAILADLEKNWGIDVGLWQRFRFILTSTRLWLVNESIHKVLKPRFVFAGLLLAEKRLFGWKLLNSSAQVFSDYISRRRIEIDDDLLKALFEKGRVSCSVFADGYYALEYNKKILASVYVENKEIRINLPHNFNLII